MSNPGVQRVVRPTLRCLFEDLGSEVGPADLRLALGNGQAVVAVDETFLFPCSLADAEHPIIEKANLLATDEAAARERIETITDRYAIKVKTGDRRAAIWRDESGVWWLLAAGHRKDDGPGDFYRELKRFSRDSTPIAPTQTDERYRRLEVAYAAQVEEERTAHGDLLGALLAAAARPGTPNEIALHGAVVSVRVDPDESGLAVLELSWDFTCFDEQDRFPMDVLAMVPGQEDIDSWEYLPPRRDDDRPHSWFTYVTREWVEELATSAELDGLLAEAGDWSPTNPSSDGSEHFSHRARGEVVTLAYVTGIGIVALCGARVVAHRDYERFRCALSARRALLYSDSSNSTPIHSCPDRGALGQPGGPRSSGPTTLVGRSHGLARFGLGATSLAEDAHDLVGWNAQCVSNGKALDASLLTEASQVSARHAEKLGCLVRSERLATSDGGNGLASRIGIDSEQELVSDGTRKRREVELAGVGSIVSSVTEAISVGSSELTGINDVHGRGTHAGGPPSPARQPEVVRSSIGAATDITVSRVRVSVDGVARTLASVAGRLRGARRGWPNRGSHGSSLFRRLDRPSGWVGMGGSAARRIETTAPLWVDPSSTANAVAEVRQQTVSRPGKTGADSVDGVDCVGFLTCYGRCRFLGWEATGGPGPIDGWYERLRPWFEPLMAGPPGHQQTVTRLNGLATTHGGWVAIGAWKVMLEFSSDLMDEGRDALVACHDVGVTNLAIHMPPVEAGVWRRIFDFPPPHDGFFTPPVFSTPNGPQKTDYFKAAATAAVTRCPERLDHAPGVAPVETPPSPSTSAATSTSAVTSTAAAFERSLAYSLWDFGQLLLIGAHVVQEERRYEPAILAQARSWARAPTTTWCWTGWSRSSRRTLTRRGAPSVPPGSARST